jgi:thymidylate synthase
MTEAWPALLRDVLAHGREVSPRGRRTREIPQHTIAVDMRRPVLLTPERKLSYQFMAAEAYWILTGDDRVETIAPWNKNIGQFSDDGVKYFGAYGPKVLDQLDYVVAKLIEDPSSRQAGLTIWREKPPKTKDVPCTVAMFFSIREPHVLGLDALRLEANVFMRSNDVWLGTPYDVFNFSMVGHLVCARLNAALDKPDGRTIEPGALRLTAASSHIYETHWAEAKAIVESTWAGNLVTGKRAPEPQTPDALFEDASALRHTLRELRDSKPGHDLRWWEVAR